MTPRAFPKHKWVRCVLQNVNLDINSPHITVYFSSYIECPPVPPIVQWPVSWLSLHSVDTPQGLMFPALWPLLHPGLGFLSFLFSVWVSLDRAATGVTRGTLTNSPDITSHHRFSATINIWQLVLLVERRCWATFVADQVSVRTVWLHV